MSKMSIRLIGANGRKTSLSVETNKSKSGAIRPFIAKSSDSEFIQNLVTESGLTNPVEQGQRYAYCFLNGTELSAMLSSMVPEVENVVARTSVGEDQPFIGPLLPDPA